jgi:hypothetical protein
VPLGLRAAARADRYALEHQDELHAGIALSSTGPVA